MKTAQVRALLKDFLPAEAHEALNNARTIGEFRLVLKTWTAAQSFHARQLQEQGVRLAEENPPTRLRDAAAANGNGRPRHPQDGGTEPGSHSQEPRPGTEPFRAWDEPTPVLAPTAPVGAPANEWRRLFLTRVGSRKIEVIKAIRAITGLGLSESKDLADAAQLREEIVGEFHMTAADLAARALVAAGAAVRSEVIGGRGEGTPS